jgi:hypothetical protein
VWGTKNACVARGGYRFNNAGVGIVAAGCSNHGQASVRLNESIHKATSLEVEQRPSTTTSATRLLKSTACMEREGALTKVLLPKCSGTAALAALGLGDGGAVDQPGGVTAVSARAGVS